VEHKEFVKDIADRLVKDNGIDVMLDRYDLNPGDDKYVYMESVMPQLEMEKLIIKFSEEKEPFPCQKGNV
jgi:hypothetical protein